MRILRFRWGQPKINKKIFSENGVIFVAICAVLLYNIPVSGWKFVFFTRRGVAQVVARMVRVHEVVSSSLVTSTKLKAFSIGRSLFSLLFCTILYKVAFKTEPWGKRFRCEKIRVTKKKEGAEWKGKACGIYIPRNKSCVKLWKTYWNRSETVV